ncbi:MAG: tetratricopeptide repeat protein [Alcaligenaceae bacterium]|nr:tetratricopeptide repeat protein [Alcaligenaceae bacterium]
METSYWIIGGVVVALLVCILLFLRVRPKDSGRSWYFGFLLIPLIAGSVFYFLYLKDQRDPAATFERTGNIGQFIDAVSLLEQRVEANPEDFNGQLMLAHSYRAMGRYEDAVARFGKAWPLVEKDPNNLALFAGALAIYRGGFEGKPMELISQALALEANNPDALMLLGGAMFQQGDYVEAIKSWERLLADQSIQEEDKIWIQEQLDEAKLAESDPVAYAELLKEREIDIFGEGGGHPSGAMGSIMAEPTMGAPSGSGSPHPDFMLGVPASGPNPHQ